MPYVLRVFIMKGWWILPKVLPASVEMIPRVLTSFSGCACWVCSFAYVEPSLPPWDESYFENVLWDPVCLYFLRFSAGMFIRDIGGVSFSVVSLPGFYWGDVGVVE